MKTRQFIFYTAFRPGSITQDTNHVERINAKASSFHANRYHAISCKCFTNSWSNNIDLTRSCHHTLQFECIVLFYTPHLLYQARTESILSYFS